MIKNLYIKITGEKNNVISDQVIEENVKYNSFLVLKSSIWLIRLSSNF